MRWQVARPTRRHCRRPDAAFLRGLALRGRTQAVSQALQYMQEIKGVEALSRYAFETPDPQIASDSSATFEVKGERRP